MSKLRKKLREGAEADLSGMVSDIQKSATEIACLGVEPNDLMRLAIGGRVESLQAQVLTKMVNAAEDALIAKYNDQAELPMSRTANGSNAQDAV